jgi:cellulose synthase/poly-beta-1,6-N-acetylglucosamine synthase-like glycosyltransferase
MSLLVLIFWFCLFAVVYAYLIYPGMLLLAGMLRPRPVQHTPIEPHVSLLIPAFNEEAVIREKLENSLTLDYPSEQLEIVVVSDCSTDRTDDIVRGFAPRVTLKRNEFQMGKIGGLSRVIHDCHGEIIVITDANASFERDALRKLIRNFADLGVGCVSGKRVLRSKEGQIAQGQGLYWKYENALRIAESSVYSTAFTLGAMTAIKRALFLPLPGELEFDQVWSLHVVNSGYRSIYEPEAVFYEEAHPSVASEFKMHFRNTIRGFTMVGRLREFMDVPKHRFFAFHVLSRKVSRWLVGLFAFLLLVSSAMLSFKGRFYALMVLLQIVFYFLALAGYWEAKHQEKHSRIFYIPFFFTLINTATFWAFIRYLCGLRMKTWSTGRERAPANEKQE